MKKLLGILIAGLSLLATSVLADVYVHGYYRSDGTYVAPHWRSSPNGSYNDNWSVRGNLNPYTGEFGTHSPTLNDHTPSYNRKHYGDPLYFNW